MTAVHQTGATFSLLVLGPPFLMSWEKLLSNSSSSKTIPTPSIQRLKFVTESHRQRRFSSLSITCLAKKWLPSWTVNNLLDGTRFPLTPPGFQVGLTFTE